jgi:hypothetical protein
MFGLGGKEAAPLGLLLFHGKDTLSISANLHFGAILSFLVGNEPKGLVVQRLSRRMGLTP